MAIDLNQYRATIGIFLSVYHLTKQTWKNLYDSKYFSSLAHYWYIFFLKVLILFVVTSFTYFLSLNCMGNVTAHSGMPITDALSNHDLNQTISCYALPSTETLSIFVDSLFMMVTNFESRCKYGNKKASGIKIAHWNKGGSFLINKMTDVKSIISNHRPMVLGLSEANLYKNHDKSLAEIPGFKLHYCPTMNNPAYGVSRVVVYTHGNLVSKREQI